MKNLILILSLLAVSTFAQNLKPRKLEPAKDHYKDLGKLKTAAIPDTTDRQHFPIDGMSVNSMKRLKIKSVYLNFPAMELKIPDFPANSSEQTKAELKFLHDLENTRTPEQVENSKILAGVFYNINTKPGDNDYEKMQRNLFHMGRQISWFNAEKLPKTAEMMRKVWSDATYYFWALKFQFNRTRPYMLDKTLKPVDTGTNFQAYPSGHASASYVAAYIYQELIPEHKELLLKNAFEMAYSREIIGVHFPSDSEAGRIFAREFINKLMQNDTFKADFKVALAEINTVKQNQ